MLHFSVLLSGDTLNMQRYK